MGKLRSGILGQIRGKVAGVVGGQWKDVNYVREYVKPANPNTAAQQTQRGLFGSAVGFSRPLVGPVFNTYTDQFQKSMSGFNAFIKENISYFTASPTFSSVTVTQGKLFETRIVNGQADATLNVLNVIWSVNTGSNGANTDGVYIVAYNADTERWGFLGAEGQRSLGASGEDISLSMSVDDVIHVWAFGIQRIGTRIDMISTSDYETFTAVAV